MALEQIDRIHAGIRELECRAIEAREERDTLRFALEQTAASLAHALSLEESDCRKILHNVERSLRDTLEQQG